MEISMLADHPEFLPTLAGWYAREWPPYYGKGGPGNARVDLESRCNRDSIPVGLIALRRTELLGVVALDRDPATNLIPSVVGLLVADEYRGQGIAAALLESVTVLAKQLGYSRTYISTNVLGDYLEKNSWRLFGATRFINDERGSIYALDLQ